MHAEYCYLRVEELVMAEKKSRIKVADLSEDLQVTDEEMKKVRGGLLLSSRTDLSQIQTVKTLQIDKLRAPFGMDIDCW